MYIHHPSSKPLTFTTKTTAANLPTFIPNNRKNPFASGCRGISAKRSQSPAIQRAPSMADNLPETTHLVSAFRWPQPRARFNLADLLFRPLEMQPPPFVGGRRLDNPQSPFNLEFYQLFGDPRGFATEVNNNNGRLPVNE